jgi:hypothetical protein
MEIIAVFCYVVITIEPLIPDLRSSADSNASTCILVGNIAYKSAITDLFGIQNFEVLTYTELVT